MEGYIKKRRHHYFGSKWMNRYLVLKGRHLNYYGQDTDKIPRRSIALQEGHDISAVMPRQDSSEMMYTLRLEFGGESGGALEFGVTSADEAEQWRKAIETAIASSNDVASTPRFTKKVSSVEVDQEDLGDLPSPLRYDGHLKKALSSVETPLSSAQCRVVFADGGLTVFQDRSSVLSSSGVYRTSSAASAKEATAAPSADGEGEGVNGFTGDSQRLRLAANNNRLLLCALGLYLLITVVFAWLLGFGLFASNVVGAMAAVALVGIVVRMRPEAEIPSLLAARVVRGSPRTVFEQIMEPCPKWDGCSESLTVLEKLDAHSDIIHIVHRPVRGVFGWHQPRDLVLVRYWRREADGTYFILLQNTQHKKAPQRSGYVRGEVLSCAYVISPPKPELVNGSDRLFSHVTIMLRYNPKALASWLKKFSHEDLSFELPWLRTVASLSEYMQSADFVDPVFRNRMANDDVTDRMSTTEVNERWQTAFPSEMWLEPHASKFKVRSETYLRDKVKATAREARFHLVACELLSFERDAQQTHVCARRAIPRPESNSGDKLIFVVNLIMPGNRKLPPTSLLFYFEQAASIDRGSSKFADLLTDFLEGDDQFRRSRFKMIPDIVEGPFVARHSVRGKPVIFGHTSLGLNFINGPGWFEVDIDVTSDPQARFITSMVLGMTKSVVVDLAFLIESQSEAELPESILGAVRLARVDLAAAVPFQPSTPTGGQEAAALAKPQRKNKSD